ncbi:hypothetical protein [Microseira sp. BLCC-F43]|jgi:hypothetical protein|uniref:hypothetical protein n=1 Tax=Microseira sp. BLCC-F43 TaxID=3153602 RepID=UPI0035B8306C
MTTQPQLPDPEKVKQTVTKMREVCRQFDNLNLALDELIAQVEADIRKSPLTAYRLGKIKSVPQSVESEK